MSQLQYHQALFTLLGIEPVVSPERQATIAERERVCGAAFPAAVKEWMSIEGVETLFFENSNNDFLPSIGDEIEWMAREDGKLGQPEHTNAGYLCVAIENQGVVIWYVRLDEGDDPPVYHDSGGFYSGDGETAWPPAGIEWVKVADKYSTFIHYMLAPQNRLYLSALDRAPNLDERERLGERFIEAHTGTPMVHWIIPHPTVHIAPLARIEMQPLSPKGDKAMWLLDAASPDALKALLEGLRDIANLTQTLETNSEEVAEILQQFRPQKGDPTMLIETE